MILPLSTDCGEMQEDANDVLRFCGGRLTSQVLKDFSEMEWPRRSETTCFKRRTWQHHILRFAASCLTGHVTIKWKTSPQHVGIRNL